MKKFRFKYQWSYILLWVCLVLGVVVACFAGLWGIPVVVVGIIQAAVFYRCPHCGRSLLNYRGVPNCCPHCGQELFRHGE